MTRFATAALLIATLAAPPVFAADAAPQPLGIYDPEAGCKGPVETPACAYKTWFFCRIAGLRDMCRHVLGKAPASKDWEDRPWVLPLSVLMSGPLALNGFAFIGSLKVDSERLGDAPAALKKRLLGTVEVMDTYVDPQRPDVAYVGSEFYREAKAGQWVMVGWSMSGEGGNAPTECDAASAKDDDLCKLRVTGIKSWAEMLRGAGAKK